MSSMGLPLQSLFEVSTAAAMVGQLDTPTGANAGPGIGVGQDQRRSAGMHKPAEARTIPHAMNLGPRGMYWAFVAAKTEVTDRSSSQAPISPRWCRLHVRLCRVEAVALPSGGNATSPELHSQWHMQNLHSFSMVPTISLSGLSLNGEFREPSNGRPGQRPTAAAREARTKRLMISLLTILGVSYSMHKLLRLLAERHRQQQQQLAESGCMGAGPMPDPLQLTKVRALYRFDASSPVALEENAFVVVMSKLDLATGAEVGLRRAHDLGGRQRAAEGRPAERPGDRLQPLEKQKPVEGAPEPWKIE
ncbi:hypothetical protein BD413DRAFT_681740 [Trametes elegans]|nr:hypothetical protein BD413DRAFT_681740 [Trametes elegans]